jgi:hypothetical protein
MTTAPEGPAYPPCCEDVGDEASSAPLRDTLLNILGRVEITHYVLRLCRSTDEIGRTKGTFPGLTPSKGGWFVTYKGSPYCHGLFEPIIFAMAITTLDVLGLIAWFDDRDGTSQYAEETSAGREALNHWDAALLGGAV